MFRRFRRPGLARAGISPAQLEVLSNANRLNAQGRFLEAAGMFAGLAQEMQASLHPRREANLRAQAAHAYADGKDAAQSQAQARAALNLFLQYGMAERTPRFYANITHKQRGYGMAAAADTLEKEFGDRIGRLPSPPPTAQVAARGRLPAACPGCGAPVRSDEVSWVDAHSAECSFCGSILQTTT